jgi:hypothetical protein
MKRLTQMKISIKAYVMDESLSWEERYKQLEAHHNEETKWLIRRIASLEEIVEVCLERAAPDDHRDLLNKLDRLE